MSKAVERKAIWPLGFAKNTGAVQGNSPIPAIQVVARSGRGKSSFIATLPGDKKIFDVEGSFATLRFQSDMDIVDIREKSKKFKSKNFQLNLFEAFLEELQSLPAGQFDILGTDTFSDLYFGSFFWVGEHADIFGKTPQRYSGKEGTIAQWADTRTYWKELVMQSTQKVQTAIFTSHPKDLYDKTTGQKTGQQDARGADITEAVTLKLWLFDERDENSKGQKPSDRNFVGERWAYVDKHRLSWHYKPEGAEFARLLDLLPRKLVPSEKGMTFGELIHRYMARPEPDYGDLDKVVGNPTAETQNPDEIAAQKAHELELQLKLRVDDGKRDMAERLIKDGLYPDMGAIKTRIIELNLLDDVQDLERQLHVEAKLREVAQKQPA